MKPRADRAISARRFAPRELVSYAVMAAAVWLAWEVVKAPVVDRAPPALAIRLAPTSPEVLRRAAEAELVAERFENAKALADDSLVRAPFNARAMRVRGLTEARLGEERSADEMLTLAGNWSLRDDPAHAWLVEYRLRRGDYGSAFAHADTLARRRPDLHSNLFNLYRTAAGHDPRAVGALVAVLQRNPPWREAFLEEINDTDEGAAVAGTLALALETTDAPFTPYELQRLYSKWLEGRRFAGVKELRRRLNRPPSSTLLQNGDFGTDMERQIYPFGWQLGHAPGVGGLPTEDDVTPENTAYRLEYDGFGSGVFLDQLLVLTPGNYVLSWDQRVEAGDTSSRLEWQILCSGSASGFAIGSPSGGTNQAGEWRKASTRFSVPENNCDVQWLRLVTRPGDRRTTIAMWLDNVSLQVTQPQISRPGT